LLFIHNSGILKFEIRASSFIPKMKLSIDECNLRPDQIFNLFHTFGYTVFENSFSDCGAAELRGIASQIIKARRGVELSEWPIGSGCFEGSVIEDFPALGGFFFSETMVRAIEAIAGKQWLYLGSDLSLFSPLQTQPWHRDWITHLPVLKIGVYLHEALQIGGELKIIPGSHRIGDSYCKMISKGLAWPRPLQSPGGLNENNFFPPNVNFSNHPADRDYLHLLPGHSEKNFSPSKPINLPHASIPLDGVTQTIFFDLRTIHCGTIGLPINQRIMMSALFCPNPFDESFDYQSIGVTTSREDLAKELMQVMALDRLHHGMLDHTYHKDGKEPNIGVEHKVSIKIKDRHVYAEFGNLNGIACSRDEIFTGGGAVWDMLTRVSDKFNEMPAQQAL